MNKILIDRAVVEQALAALLICDNTDASRAMAAITALRAALAEPVQEPATLPGPGLVMCPACCSQFDPALNRVEPVQEPVAEARYDGTLRWLEPHGVGLHRIQGPLYTAPPQRKPLTSDKDRQDQGSTYVNGYGYVDTRAVRAVERSHGIGEPYAL